MITQTEEGSVIVTPDDGGTVAVVIAVEVAANNIYSVTGGSLLLQEDNPKMAEAVIKFVSENYGQPTRMEGRPNPFDLLPIPKGPTSSLSDAPVSSERVVSAGPVERGESGEECPGGCGNHYRRCSCN